MLNENVILQVPGQEMTASFVLVASTALLKGLVNQVVLVTLVHIVLLIKHLSLLLESCALLVIFVLKGQTGLFNALKVMQSQETN